MGQSVTSRGRGGRCRQDVVACAGVGGSAPGISKTPGSSARFGVGGPTTSKCLGSSSFLQPFLPRVAAACHNYQEHSEHKEDNNYHNNNDQEYNPGQYREVHPGQYHEQNPGQYHEVNPGQYHEVHPGQVDVESVKVDFQHRSKDRIYNVQASAGDFILGEVGRIDNSGQTLQGVRYTAVEGEVDEARITEILNRYFGARTM